jgi:hypothetical protein
MPLNARTPDPRAAAEAVAREALDDLARRIVAWPDSTAPDGRAYVVGYSP